MPTYVTISRKWHNPKIKITVDTDGIELCMEIADFVAALKAELGSPAFIIKKKTLAEKIDAGVASIICGIKQESNKVIGKQ